MEKFLYIEGLNICHDGQKSESGYINNYIKNLSDIAKKNDWKTTGESARFQGRTKETPEIDARITGVSAYDSGTFIYSAATGDVSGILQKNYADGREQYIIHDNKYTFADINFIEEEDVILFSAGENNQTAHIGRYDMKTNNMEILTAGDACDRAPSYRDGKIFFSSRGVGRNSSMQMVGYGPSSIYEIDRGGNCDEILAEEGYDLLTPKPDTSGNLYYIRKPYKSLKQKRGTLLDVLLFPFRLIFNFFRLLFFLANIGRKSDKKNSSSTAGANPAVNPDKSEKDLYIMGERIKLDEEEKAAARRKDKNEGIAPARFELYKKSADGTKTKIKSGIFDYDIDDEGGVYYTNGRRIIKIQGGQETVLLKDKLITNFRLLK